MPDASTVAPEPAAGGAAGAAPNEKHLFCDLLMKGGITSGIIYPRLIFELSRKYRFKNIGGTSAGAIAAGACAAAEYARTHSAANAFEQLDKLPGELSQPVNRGGRSKLFNLFQPTQTLAPAFRVLSGALNLAARDAVPGVLAGVLRLHWLLSLGGAACIALLLWPVVAAAAPMPATAASAGAAGVLLASLVSFCAIVRVFRGIFLRVVLALASLAMPAAILVLLGATWSPRLLALSVVMDVLTVLSLAAVCGLVVHRFVSSVLTGLHENNYGFCNGRTTAGSAAGTPGLTDWLTGYFDGLAGLPAKRHPLTFGDLWGGTDPDAPRQINFEVMTSAISQQMAYSVPFRPGTPTFYYDPDEWKRLFPDSVMTWLDEADRACPNGDADREPGKGIRPVSAAGKALRALPRRADLPVVVAVRMSLSFPILLSAVPLYAIDWTREVNQERKAQLSPGKDRPALPEVTIAATRIWFSDGGIGSNMPLHFFDSLLPEHPTFAVNLKPVHPDFGIAEPEGNGNAQGRVFLPENNNSGRIRFWPGPDDSTPAGGLVGFLGSIIDTMQNWRDELQFPYPGCRDRIVQISQKSDEGGLNLDMPKAVVDALANAGAMAAGRLIDRFHPDGAQAGAGWKNHQTVRLGTYLGTMQPDSAKLHASLASGHWQTIAAGIRYTAGERPLATDFLAKLQEIAALGTPPGVSLLPGALKPIAQIRITPTI
jgi:predicted acylesterase/phospholipase RssA